MLTVEQLTAKCEEILKTLPLAHYLKVKTIPVAFDTTSLTSYFDPTQFKIVVALNNIVSVIQSTKRIPNDIELENTLRCFLYHEVSHAILTPRDLMKYAISLNTTGYLLNKQFANIIEDERIETLLKSYYLNVDFKKNLRQASPLDKHIKSFEHFVLNCVRHRCSPIMPKQVNKLVDNFIISTKSISALSNDYYGKIRQLCDNMEKLLKELKTIYDMLPKSMSANSSTSQSEENGQPQENGNSSSSNSNSSKSSNNLNDEGQETENNADSSSMSEEKSDNGKQEKQTKSGKSEVSNESDETSQELDTSEKTAEEEQTEMENASKSLSSELDKMSEEEVNAIMEQALNEVKQISNLYKRQRLSDFSYEKSTKVEMLKIIGRNAGFGINKTPTQYGYGGKFNTKRFSTDFNDSCKWFAKRSYEETGANNRKNNTKVLNIWLDNSGSYMYNDMETNKILSALQSIEKSRDDFKFNLITFDTNFVLRQGEDRISVSQGGNALPKKEINDIYKKVNATGNELNIVLFDGEASWETRPNERDSYANLIAFNNNKTIFITERSNTRFIKMFCPKCKALIEENSNYTMQLRHNILKAFDLLF